MSDWMNEKKHDLDQILKNQHQQEDHVTYKLIKECGLPTTQDKVHPDTEWVRASDLEAFLSKAVRVYNPSEQDATWITAKGDWCSREALLINIREIPKLEPVSKEEFLEGLKTLIAKVQLGIETKEDQELIDKLIQLKVGVKP